MTLGVVCEANLGMILEPTLESNLEAKAEAIPGTTLGAVTMILEMIQGTAMPHRMAPVLHRLGQGILKGRQVRQVEQTLWLSLFDPHLHQRTRLQSPHQMEDYRKRLEGDMMKCGIELM
jgi:hypothetical protein